MPLSGTARQLDTACQGFLEGVLDKPLEEFQQDLQTINRSLEMLPDFLFCLEQLGHLPPKLASAFRTLPLDCEPTTPVA